MNNFSHISVMLEEAVEALNASSGRKYIDATLGGGGHTQEIIKKGGTVLGIDQDEDALEFVRAKYISEIENKKLVTASGNFGNIKEIAIANGFDSVSGILFDLGVSSYQIDASERGFSIKKDEKLDMRMDTKTPLTAMDVVNDYARDRLIDIFYRYGEEHNSIKIADAIVDRRKRKPITTTKELSELIERVPHKSEAIHPATRVFQAIRIEVNGELSALKNGLENALTLLENEGRIVVISFHSLEDRIVKQTFSKFEREGMGKSILKKPLSPTENETDRNRRSRSAKLRIFELKNA